MCCFKIFIEIFSFKNSFVTKTYDVRPLLVEYNFENNNFLKLHKLGAFLKGGFECEIHIIYVLNFRLVKYNLHHLFKKKYNLLKKTRHLKK